MTSPGCIYQRDGVSYHGDGRLVRSSSRPYTPSEAQLAASQLTEELGRIARERAWKRLLANLPIKPEDQS
jgi:hypothetical protein